MKRETSSFLAKAREDLREARIAADVGLNNVAARLAYYAMFHMAEAVIFERTGKTPKTHNGVRTEFARVTRLDERVEQGFVRLLSQFYVYKETADYAIATPLRITAGDVEYALTTASNYLEAMETLLSEEPRS